MTKTWYENSTIWKNMTKINKSVNHKPVVPTISSTISDLGNITGNLLAGAKDADKDTLTIVGISFNSVAKTIGASFSTTYGTMVVAANGAYTYTTNSTANALATGQNVTEIFTFSVSDGQSAIVSSTVSINITGQSSGPTAVADIGRTPYNTVITGNVLSNDINLETSSLSVTQYAISGVGGAFSAGTTQSIASGSIIINSNGAYTFTPIDGFSGLVPTITYTVSNTFGTTTGTLNLTVSTPSTAIGSNPITTAMTGLRTFNVGPGQTYLELDTVPWSTLTAGDVVNIYYRSTPYTHKFGICVMATSINRVYINGVTDSNGNRPKINGDGARTASGAMPSGNPIFQTGMENLGVVTVLRKTGTPVANRPCFITIQNLELYGARQGATCYDADGSAATWGFSAGIWCQASTDIEIINNLVYDCSLGLFSNSQAGGDDYGSERHSILYNRIYGNGIVNDDHCHNVYNQCYDTIFKGNYLGNLRAGAIGAAYKSRAGKEVVAFNWIEGNGTLLDMVQADNYYDGMVVKTDYGTSWVYGNVLLTDESTGGIAYRIIHFGGDNQGEQDATGGLTTSPTNYRTQLYFWNNTVYSHGTIGANQYFMKLSYKQQNADLWNNIIYQDGPKSFHILHYSGTLNLRGTNIICSPSSLDYFAPETDNNGTYGNYMTVNIPGTVINTSPLFTGATNYDFSLATGSPALNVYTTLPAGIPTTTPTQYPLDLEPAYRTNGLFTRTLSGNLDMGPFEYVPGAPPRTIPINASAPVVTTVSGVYATGETLQVNVGAWLASPSSYTYQWQTSSNYGSTWSDISGATSSTYAGTTEVSYRCGVTATNVVGTSDIVYSTYKIISNASPATIVQTKAGTLPSGNVATTTLTTTPTIGNTLVVFSSGDNTIADNYANTWVKLMNFPADSYTPNIPKNVWITTVTNTGTSFTISNTGTVNAKETALVYEINGILDQYNSVLGMWAYTSLTLNVNRPRQLVIANSQYGISYGTTSYPILSSTPTFTLDMSETDGIGAPAGAFHMNVPSNQVLTVTQTAGGAAAYMSTFLLSFLPKP